MCKFSRRVVHIWDKVYASSLMSWKKDHIKVNIELFWLANRIQVIYIDSGNENLKKSLVAITKTLEIP
jgi:hypothetical protein